MEIKDLNNEDILLELAAGIIAEDELTTIDIPIDKEILNMCIDYDERKAKKKRVFSVLPKIAVILLAAVLSFEIFFPETAEAFHTRIFHLTFDHNSGSVSLNSESEYEMIRDWTDYHYPEYIPEGFVLSDARKREFDSILLYANSDKTVTIRIMEENLDASMSVDTDTTEMELVKVGIYEGYLFLGVDYDGVMLTWIQNDRRMIISTTKDLSKDEIVKIGANLKYIE